MNTTATSVDLVYPESDGEPMADNTQQARWIVLLYDNFNAQYRDHAEVFVAADLMWYPIEGYPEIKQAPDVFVAFGRPKGDRRSYQQWRENKVPPTVVFEIRSPKNSDADMNLKLAFYDQHQVEEYYVYDPETNEAQGFRRQGGSLRQLPSLDGFVSPRLGIRFEFTEEELTVYGPDGRPFLPFEEVDAQRQQAEQRRDQERHRADQERHRADQEHRRAEAAQLERDQERQRAAAAQLERDQERQRADQERRRAEAAQQRATRLAELSRKARRGQATSEELQELERLEE